MGTALSFCIVDDSWEPEEVFLQKMLKRYLDSGEAKLSLAVASLPGEPSSSAHRTLFSSTEKMLDVWIETLQGAKGWSPLRWRFGSAGVPGLRFWRAKVVTALLNGEVRSQWCLLQVQTLPGERTMDNAMLDRQDALKVAAHAQKFNKHILGPAAGEVLDMVPGVSVCIPTVCKVLQSPVPQFFAKGDVLLLLPYVAPEVTKFVFDGHEDFLEIPHAFFHYVAWSTGGSECVSDLQGTEQDTGEVILVNPCIPRPLAFGPGLLFDNLPGGASQALQPHSPSPQMFDAVHPRCGPLCKSFDPERRGKPIRRHCGIPIACGLGQGSHGPQGQGTNRSSSVSFISAAAP